LDLLGPLQTGYGAPMGLPMKARPVAAGLNFEHQYTPAKGPVKGRLKPAEAPAKDNVKGLPPHPHPLTRRLLGSFRFRLWPFGGPLHAPNRALSVDIVGEPLLPLIER
jgi:hypothetical protein